VQVEPASVPTEPVRPKPLQNSLLAGVVGLLLSFGAVSLIEYMDDTLKTPEDVDFHLQLPVIGLIGEMKSPNGKGNEQAIGKFVVENPLSPITEAFRDLRTNLDFAGVDKPLKTLLITSPNPEEGKTTIATNLAAVIAQGEKKVILVDADLRKPSIHKFLELPNSKGLSDLFRDQTMLSEVITSWADTSVEVITSGKIPPNPTELLTSVKMEKMLDELKGKANIVILDTPPGFVTDPIALSAKVDGVLIVISPGKTRIGSAQVLMEHLQRAGARVIGVVMNPISRHQSHYYSKYHQYSSYYYSRKYSHYTGSDRPKAAESQSEVAAEREKGSATRP
jgi:succinoglycan biosynthesis transport protein ExoP